MVLKKLLLHLLFILFLCVSVEAQSREILISTNMGDMKFMLYDDTPLHRDGFIELVEQHYFNQTLFYRVIQGFMIQGGSKDSRNAPKGKNIGYGDPDKTVHDEIIDHCICKKGALCAPRQPDEINPYKQSDISQFFIVQGRVHRPGQLDTMEMAVNRPIKKKIVKQVYTEEKRAILKQLKAEKRLKEARDLAEEIKSDIEIGMELNLETLYFSDLQREAYTTIGGAPELDNEYTVFGEIIEGFEVIDKIASLKTDENDRPYTDVIITLKMLK